MVTALSYLMPPGIRMCGVWVMGCWWFPSQDPHTLRPLLFTHSPTDLHISLIHTQTHMHIHTHPCTQVFMCLWKPGSVVTASTPATPCSTQ